jgi:uncharacterized membrane protein
VCFRLRRLSRTLGCTSHTNTHPCWCDFVLGVHRPFGVNIHAIRRGRDPRRTRTHTSVGVFFMFGVHRPFDIHATRRTRRTRKHTLWCVFVFGVFLMHAEHENTPHWCVFVFSVRYPFRFLHPRHEGTKPTPNVETHPSGCVFCVRHLSCIRRCTPKTKTYPRWCDFVFGVGLILSVLTCCHMQTCQT